MEAFMSFSFKVCADALDLSSHMTVIENNSTNLLSNFSRVLLRENSSHSSCLYQFVAESIFVLFYHLKLEVEGFV